MHIRTKNVIRENGMHEVRIKSLDWNGKRYGLVVDGEIKEKGSLDRIEKLFEMF